MIAIKGRPVVTADAMRAAEQAHGDLAGLMDRAGRGVGEAVRRLAGGAEVLVLCGPGNNGGDGYVAAAYLHAMGHRVRVARSAEPRTELAKAAASHWTGPVEDLAATASAPVVVDALFGTGLSRPLEPAIADPLRRLVEAATLAIAVDLPSGVGTDDGALLVEDAPGFTLTLALGAIKPAHVLQPAMRTMGAIRLVPLGLSSRDLGSMVAMIAPPRLAAPDPDSHKYSRGMVAIVVGTMAGAARLSAEAALRSGAGYAALYGDTSGLGPAAVVHRPLGDTAALDDARIGAIVIGPGLGRDDAARNRLAQLIAADRHPLVIDGDALHLLDPATLPNRDCPVILTPHAGEFKALFGDGPGSVIDRARDAARATGAVVVFKGATTVIANRHRAIVHPGGSAWLSTAGTGDVLTGAIAAMLAGGHGTPIEAAAAGVWLHAEAGRRCGASFIADDLAAALTLTRASL